VHLAPGCTAFAELRTQSVHECGGATVGTVSAD
jgi:hypothetical protein